MVTKTEVTHTILPHVAVVEAHVGKKHRLVRQRVKFATLIVQPLMLERHTDLQEPRGIVNPIVDIGVYIVGTLHKPEN